MINQQSGAGLRCPWAIGFGQVGPTNIQWYDAQWNCTLGVVWPIWYCKVWYGLANIQATFRHCQVSAANSINHHTAMIIITNLQKNLKSKGWTKSSEMTIP